MASDEVRNDERLERRAALSAAVYFASVWLEQDTSFYERFRIRLRNFLHQGLIMARARNIKPGLFKNEVLGVADPIYTLAFEGLWLLADREGRLEDRPLRIKAETFPYRDGVDINAILDWLKENDFITRYTVAGKAFIQINNFGKHQNPHKNEPESVIPSIEEIQTSTENIGTRSEFIGSARADSLNLIPDSIEEATPLVASKLPTCPQQEIIEMYGEILPELPFPRIWEGERQKNLAARWKWVLSDLQKKGHPVTRESGLDFFRRFFDYISTRDLLMGRSGDWTASLDWIVQSKNFAKIIQGNYTSKAAA